MIDVQHSCRDDLRGSALTLFAAAADLCMREAYHGVAGESAGISMLAGAGFLLTAAAVVVHNLDKRQAVAITVRVIFVAAFGLALFVSSGGGPAKAWSQGGATRLLIIVGAGAIVGAGGVAYFGSNELWVRLRRALTTAILLFLTSQPLLGLFRSQPIMWPRGFVPADARADSHRNVTMILLFDELNANQSQGLIGVLEQAGLRVAAKAVESVGENTNVVVPSMFAEHKLDEARPCSPWMTCGSSMAVDYSRITATRLDIDVVGFFQPYCAIDGLRSCFRATIPMTFVDDERIRCALLRRFGLRVGLDAQACRNVYFRTWGQMTEEIIKVTLHARALTEGGVLFAHIPLPHPPGLAATGQLREHYQMNLVRAADLLRQLIATAKSADLDPRVLIFSDHPLRQGMWCESYPPYVWDRCRPDPALMDTTVPLIAAGRAVPDLSTIADNLRVFALASSWADRSVHEAR